MVYDRTCTGKPYRPGLSHAWSSGKVLYRALGRIDHAIGVSSWDDAFRWLGTVGGETPISEIQYWGHGKWGLARVDRQVFDAGALKSDHRWAPALDRIADRLLPQGRSTVWFRTCETLGCVPGQEFAQRFTERMQCRIAGHTFIIGHWQSGLHTLAPGQTPRWSAREGLKDGSPQSPSDAHWSRLWHPNTISFLHGTIPAGY
ncbi:MAG: hypothetical protein ACRBN8_41820 [Nannocystales bacterium]